MRFKAHHTASYCITSLDLYRLTAVLSQPVNASKSAYLVYEERRWEGGFFGSVGRQKKTAQK